MRLDRARAEGAGAVNSDANQIWWTYGESNPDLVHAMDAFYRYTIGPLSTLYHKRKRLAEPGA